MTLLWKRAVSLVVGNIEVSGLDVAFNIEKTTQRDPNMAEIRIWNLTENQRNEISEQAQVRCRLEVGYESGTFVLFDGELREAYSERDGPDWITVVFSGDGERKIRTQRINESFRPGTPISVVVRSIVRALGVGEGNLGTMESQMTREGQGGASFVHGTVVSGNPARILADVLASCGLEYTIINGALVITERARGSTTGPLLSPDSGLIGSPEVSSDGIVRCTALIQPDLEPTSRIKIESARVVGQYRVEKAIYHGSTFDSDWYVDIEAKVERA